MKVKNVNPLEQHVEKITLAVAALVAGYLGYSAFTDSVVVDKWGGGVTAGIDFGLALLAELAGRTTAEAVQLHLEYAPAPPFDAGDPDAAPVPVREAVERRLAPILAERARLVADAAKRLGLGG